MAVLGKILNWVDQAVIIWYSAIQFQLVSTDEALTIYWFLEFDLWRSLLQHVFLASRHHFADCMALRLQPNHTAKGCQFEVFSSQPTSPFRTKSPPYLGLSLGFIGFRWPKNLIQDSNQQTHEAGKLAYMSSYCEQKLLAVNHKGKAGTSGKILEILFVESSWNGNCQYLKGGVYGEKHRIQQCHVVIFWFGAIKRGHLETSTTIQTLFTPHDFGISLVMQTK